MALSGFTIGDAGSGAAAPAAPIVPTNGALKGFSIGDTSPVAPTSTPLEGDTALKGFSTSTPPVSTNTPPIPKPADLSGAFSKFVDLNKKSAPISFTPSIKTESSTPTVTGEKAPKDLADNETQIHPFDIANDLLIRGPGELLGNTKFMQEASAGTDAGDVSGNFGQNLLQKLAIGLQGISGLTGGIYKAPEGTQPQNPDILDKGLATLTQGIGMATGIGLIGKAAGAIPVVGRGIQALTGFANKYPLTAKYLAPFIAPLVENTTGVTIHGQLDPNLAGDLKARGKRFLTDLATAPVYTALGAVSNPAYSLPSSFGLGFGMAKLSGASNQDAVTSGLAFAFLDAAGRAESTRGLTPDEIQAKLRQEALAKLQPYSDVKLTEDSSAEDLKAAYYRAAHQTHPDVGGTPEAFISVQSAYDILSRGAVSKAPKNTTEAETSVQALSGSVKDALQQHGEMATEQGLKDHLGLDDTTARKLVNAAKVPDIQAAHERALEKIQAAETATAKESIAKAKEEGASPARADVATVYFNEQIRPVIKEGRTVVVDPDEVRKYFNDYTEPNRLTYSQATQDILERALKENKDKNFTLVGGGSGSGKSEFLTKGLVADNHPGVIYDATQSDPNFVARLLEKARSMGKEPQAFFMISDPADARFWTLVRAAETGRDVLHDYFVKVHSNYPHTILKLAEDGVPVHAIDARGKSAETISREIEKGKYVDNVVDLIKNMDHSEATVRAAALATESFYDLNRKQSETSESVDEKEARTERSRALREGGESKGGNGLSSGKERAFAGFKDLTTTLLDQLVGKTTVSRQYIEDLTNQNGIKAAERDLFLRLLSEEPATVNVQDFADKVKLELLPLTAVAASSNSNPRYDSIVLPQQERGPVARYQEKLYESPIKTSAGDIHFSEQGGYGTGHYFAHTRIEDLPSRETKYLISPAEGSNGFAVLADLDNGESFRIVAKDFKTKEDAQKHIDALEEGGARRVIELQSDLFQKGRLEDEGDSLYAGKTHQEIEKLAQEKFPTSTISYTKESTDELRKRGEELTKLKPFENTWHERIIREEIKQAAIDGKTKLQFPTGETAMKIEGLGESSRWYGGPSFADIPLEPNDLKVGREVAQSQYGDSNTWIITDVLGDGKFKAVPKDQFEALRGDMANKNNPRPTNEQIIDQFVREVSGTRGIQETFDISGKVDTQNPIYKFYEKDVADYLRKNYSGHAVTDERGITWNEVPVKADYAEAPVNVFSAGQVKKVQPKVRKPMKQPGGFVNPGAIAKDVSDAAAKLQNIVKQMEEVKTLSNNATEAAYQAMGHNHVTDYLMANLVETEGNLLDPQGWEDLIHYAEDRNYPAPEKVKQVYQTLGAPMMKQVTDLWLEYKELGGTPLADLAFIGEDDSHVIRFVKDKQSKLDKLLSTARNAAKSLRSGSVFSKSIGSLDKSRKFHLAVKIDDQNNEIDAGTVVHIPSDKSQNVLGFNDNKITDLGPVKGMRTPKVKEFFDDTVMRKLNDLATSLGIRHERQVVGNLEGKGAHTAGVSYTGKDLIRTRLSPDSILAHEIGHQIGDKYHLWENLTDDKFGAEHKSEILKEFRDLADKRFEGREVNDAFKKYVRKTEEKEAVMFEAYVANRELFQQTAPRLYDDFRQFLSDHAELRPFLDIQPTLTLGSETHGNEQSGKIGKIFVDSKGQRYVIKQATIKQIEDNTHTEYHKNFLANHAYAVATLTHAVNALKLLNRLKNEEEFGKIILKDNPDETSPEGWVSIGDMVPQFRGYHIEPRTAESLIDIVGHSNKELPRWIGTVFGATAGGAVGGPIGAGVGAAVGTLIGGERINNFLVQMIVSNPAMHVPNEISNRAVAAAAGNISTESLKNFGRAWNEVRNKGPLYLEYIKHGAPMMHLKTTTKNLADAIFTQYQGEVEKNPQDWLDIAKMLGYDTPKAFADGLGKLNEDITWGGNDIFFMQALLDYADAHGGTMEEAIREVSKYMADYRIPSRVFGSRSLSTALQSKYLLFSRFHYSGVVKPWLEAARDGATGTRQQRMAGLRALAYMLIMGIAIWPYINKMFQGITGSPTTYESMPGALRPIQVGEKFFQNGTEGYPAAVQAFFTPSPAVFDALQLGLNIDFFTRNPIIGRLPAEGFTNFATSMISPLAAASRMTPEDFTLSLFGVWTPKNVDAKNTLSQMKYEELPALQTQVKKDIAAGNVQKANEEMREFNDRAIATWNQYQLEINGTNFLQTDARKQAFLKEWGIKAPGAVAIAHANTLYGDGSLTSKSSLISTVAIYAKAIGVSPTEAFHLIFTGQSIARVTNFGLFNPDSAIIVQRAPLSYTEGIKQKQMSAQGETSTDGLQLDHVVPLEAGGTNDESNLNLITSQQDGGEQQRFENILGKAVKAGEVSREKAIEYSVRYKIGLGETLPPRYMDDFVNKYGAKAITLQEIQDAINTGAAK